MSSTKSRNKHILIKMLVGMIGIILLLVILRATHIILYVGEKYTTRFSTAYRVDNSDVTMASNVNNDNIKEIVYMKNLKHFASLYTNISDFGFLSEFTKLETLTLEGNSLHPGIVINHLPVLNKSPNLVYADLHIDIDNLDFIAESSSLEYLTILPYDAEIHDISGLRNKPKLRYLRLVNIHCSDYSILFDLPSLEALQIDENELSNEMKKTLEDKGVKITEYSKESLQKEKDEQEEWVKNVRAKTE